MDSHKNDKYFAVKIIENINAIQEYILDKTYEQFISDNILVDAVMFRFVQLIENINNVSDDFKKNNKHIPWGEIVGFRNGIVHEYGKTDFLIVYETAIQDLNDLKTVFRQLIQ